MERLIEGAREPSSFLQWQKEMRQKDLQDELAKIERKRLEGRISYEEAAMARTRLMERNQKTAQLKKEEVGKNPSVTMKQDTNDYMVHGSELGECHYKSMSVLYKHSLSKTLYDILNL